MLVVVVITLLVFGAELTSGREPFEDFLVYPGYLLPFLKNGKRFSSSFESVASIEECAFACLGEQQCASFDFAESFPMSGNGLSDGGALVRHNIFQHFEKRTAMIHSKIAGSVRTDLRYRPWFHGNLNEMELRDAFARDTVRQPGMFLVTENSELLLLHVSDGQNILSYPIIRSSRGFEAVDGTYHDRVVDIVRHYMLPGILPHRLHAGVSFADAEYPSLQPEPQKQSKSSVPMYNLSPNAECPLLRVRDLAHTPPLAAAGKPFIVEGAASTWPAASKWRFDAQAATVVSTNTLVTFPPLSDSHAVFAEHRALRQDLTPPPLFDSSLFEFLPLDNSDWVAFAVSAGQAGTGRAWEQNKLHAHRWEAVILGRAIVALYDPDTYVPGHLLNVSNDTAREWLVNTMPTLIDSRKPLLCTLEAGDLIVIPTRWWSLTYYVIDTVTVGELVCPVALAFECVRNLRKKHCPFSNFYSDILRNLTRNHNPVYDAAFGPDEAQFASAELIAQVRPNLQEESLTAEKLALVFLQEKHPHSIFNFPNLTLTSHQFSLNNYYKGCINKVMHASVHEIPFNNETIEDDIKKHAKWRWPLKITTQGVDKTLGWRSDRWTSDYLKDKAGDTEVRVQLEADVDQHMFDGSKGHYENIRFEDFLDEAYDKPFSQQRRRMYLNLQNEEINDIVVAPPLQNLLDDFSVPAFWNHTKLFQMNLWIGRSDDKGSMAQLHVDAYDNVYVLLRGRKRLTLFSPDDSFNLNVSVSLSHIDPAGRQWFVTMGGKESAIGVNFSPVIYPTYNSADFPLAKFAVPMQVEVVPGDILFIPAGWWHQVESFGQHMAVNFWSDSLLAEPSGFDREFCNERF